MSFLSSADPSYTRSHYFIIFFHLSFLFFSLLPSPTAKIPPTTRKRKLAEAIASTKSEKATNKRVVASAATADDHPSASTPTSASASASAPVPVPAPASASASSASSKPQAKSNNSSPPNPVTGMDSDEDFLSAVSSDDDVMNDTENEELSGGEGLCLPLDP